MKTTTIQKIHRPLHYEEWFENEIDWDELPRFTIMRGTHIMERSRQKNDHTHKGVALASTVKNAERIVRLLNNHEKKEKEASA